MEYRTRRRVATLLGIAGALLIGSSASVAIWKAETTTVWENSKSLTIAAQHALAIPPPPPALNARERLLARIKVPVVMPPDLVADIEDKDPRLSNWIVAWQSDHLGIADEDPQWLAVLLDETPLGAEELWRLCRQVDRGGDTYSCGLIASATLRKASLEIQQRPAILNSAYVDEIAKLKPFLIEWYDGRPLEQWARFILNAPARDRSVDISDSAEIGLVIAKIKQRQFTDANTILDAYQKEVSGRPEKMSEMNQNELHLAHGMIYEGTGAFQDALNEFDLVPRVESGDAIDAMERSTFALAHLGRKDEALHRLAQFIVEYHFPEPMGDDLATQLTKIVPGVPATTTYHS